MASRTIKAALADVLENLSEENFKKFCHHLMDLRAGPRIRRTAVEGKSCLEVADVMVSTFTEVKVVGVAEEILRDIGCTQEADDLGKYQGEDFVVSMETQNATVNINRQTFLDDEDEDFYKNLQIHEKFLIDALKDKKQRPGVDMMHRGMTSFPEISSEVKQKHFVDKQGPSWSQRVDQMVFVIELLLETMGDLSDMELEKFQQLSHYHHPSFNYTWSLTLTEETDLHDRVFLMVKTYGQESKNSLWMNICLHCFTKWQQWRLLESCFWKHSDLRQQELKKFKWFLQFTCFHKGLTQIPWRQLDWEEREEAVDLMVKMFGQLSVEVTMEVFMHMNRTDLAQRLSETSSELKGTESSAETFIGAAKEKETEEHHSVLTQKVASWDSVKQVLLKTLRYLNHKNLMKFQWLLQFMYFQRGLPQISWHHLVRPTAEQLVDLIVKRHSRQSVEVIREIFKDMNRTDLEEKLLQTSSEGEGPSRSLELVSCGSTMQDCSDWTKLEPEVNKADADETPTYSLQSGAGNFECSVSGLRWVCKNQVGFKYQFYSWEEHVERMESIQYMPAGPLIDIRVIAGKFDEVYLPHWIFIDDNPTVLDKFAVLHIDDCGDVVEKVSEVTSSHVKLPEPIFSLRGVLVKLGLLQKINCRVLIYKTTKAFLTLHVYLIPSDPGLEQAIEKREVSDGSKAIRKPHPTRFLQMHQCSILTADLDGAEICPEDLELRYENSSPNYFEIFVEKPDRDFTLRLKQNSEPVWTCVIRQGDYQRTGHIQGKHFVDRHRVDLINRVSNIGPILDDLLDKNVIQQEVYEQIRALPTTQDKIRELYSGPLKASEACKDAFYESLQLNEKFLIDDLSADLSRLFLELLNVTIGGTKVLVNGLYEESGLLCLLCGVPSKGLLEDVNAPLQQPLWLTS
ncbi:uncharacterized protein LOC113136757 [Mastacembelus armatus]|uniref:uncharacterized protein LOC113136757 n=1 Tax=Mastacembelus armatus TaxID=205130 RepID=UPI000E462910|nr:uncharacterized protein LOC113136757 [Mastacembelus armatus]